MGAANEAVLVANTPSFLLDRLRKDAAVAYLAKSLQTSEILDALIRFSKIPPSSAREIVERYVYLVALEQKDASEVWPKLDEIDLSCLEWGNQIREIMKAERIATNRVEIGSPGPHLTLPSRLTDASSSRLDRKIQSNPGGSMVLP
jgi:hypothetical protein